MFKFVGKIYLEVADRISNTISRFFLFLEATRYEALQKVVEYDNSSQKAPRVTLGER